MRDVNDDQLVGSIVFSNRVLLYILSICVVIIAALATTNFLTFMYAKNKIESIQREYFATTHNGSLFQLTPIDEPIGGEERALNFSSACVIRMFQLDFVNYIRQQNEAQLRCFTDDGYKTYLNAFERAGLTAQLKDPRIRLVLSATPGPGVLLNKDVKVFSGVARQTYTIQHPIEIIFNGNVNQPRRGLIEVDLLRVQQESRPDGLAVHAIRVKVSKS